MNRVVEEEIKKALAALAAAGIGTMPQECEPSVEPDSQAGPSVPAHALDRRESIPPCGSARCAGCYAVAPGIAIHPPKCSQDWLRRWQPGKGLVQ